MNTCDNEIVFKYKIILHLKYTRDDGNSTGRCYVRVVKKVPL